MPCNHAALTCVPQFEAHFGPSKPVYAVRDWLDIVPVSGEGQLVQ